MKVIKVAKIAEDGKVLSIEERELLEVPGLAGVPLAADEVELSDADGAVVVAAWRFDDKLREFLELPFKAMLLDEEGVLLDVVVLRSSAELTAQHVDLRPLGGDCDREPGKYRWDGTQLVPLKHVEQRSAPAGYSLEAAFAQLLELNPQLKQGDKTMVWLAGFRTSLDASKGAKK
jgi:hypothetical protein